MKSVVGTAAAPWVLARRRGRGATLLVSIVGSFVALTMNGTASAAPAPVYPGDFPDPVAIQVGTQFYAYATNVFPFGVTINVPILQSSNLSNWSYVTDALPTLGSWA